MKQTRRSFFPVLRAGAAVAAIASTLVLGYTGTAQAADAAGGQPVRIRGTIVAMGPQDMIINTREGEKVSVKVAYATVPVSAVKNVSLNMIKAGEFVGIAAKPDMQGKLTAQEVMVFPESRRGTGEGHYAWDLGSDSSMTNANIDAVVSAKSGRELSMSYKGGTQKIVVPKNVPVMTGIAADAKDIRQGKQVFVVADSNPDSTFTAQRIIIEKNGVVPPM